MEQQKPLFLCPVRDLTLSLPLCQHSFFKCIHPDPQSRICHAQGCNTQGQPNLLLPGFDQISLHFVKKEIGYIVYLELGVVFLRRASQLICRLADHVLLLLRRNRASSRGSGAPRSTNSRPAVVARRRILSSVGRPLAICILAAANNYYCLVLYVFVQFLDN